MSYFLDFIAELKIDSKEKGLIPLKDNLYRGQWYFLQEICAGLDAGIRDFVVLKSRQLGITTIILALDLFWLLVHDRLQSAFVLHEESGRDKNREIFTRFLESLPEDMKADITRHNRNLAVFSNGSVMDYLVAGTTRRSKGFGRGRAYTHVHATELGFYGNQESVDSFVAALAKNHPDRLYIWESTANGFDSPLWEKWSAAQEDTLVSKCIFIGWWGNDTYDLTDNPELFALYSDPPSEEEQDKIDLVRARHSVEVTAGMLAWYRWYSQTQSRSPNMMAQEFPWTAEEAFVSTGHKFFDQKRVANLLKSSLESYRGYHFDLTDRFVETKMRQVTDAGEAHLKVWDFPRPEGRYIIGCDPAFGSDDERDRTVIEVFRCYADALVQVAEFADNRVRTDQTAWVLAWLAGKYRGSMVNLEVSGPGHQIMMEFRHLKELATAGLLNIPGVGGEDISGSSSSPASSPASPFPSPGKMLTPPEEAARLMREAFLDNMMSARWYIWSRPDSFGAGYAYGFKTTAETKIAALNAYRDAFTTGTLTLRSREAIAEMENIEQHGWDIRASGRNHDDFVMATALSVWGYQQWIRPELIANGLSLRASAIRDANHGKPPVLTMQQYIVKDFLAGVARKELQKELEEQWATW